MLAVLPAAAILAGFLALWSRGFGAARAFLWTAVGAELIVWVSTESLSLFGLLGRPGIALAWAAALAGSAVAIRGEAVPRARIAGGWWGAVSCAAIAVPVAGAFLSAVLGPPNMVDAATYHMPRVVHWLQAGSVRFYPAGFYQQLSLQPLMEYGMAHLHALAGGDRFVQLPQWASYVGAIGCSAIVARRLGAGERGGWMAAVFCATLPMAVLQASGAKSDICAAFWLLAALGFALEATEDGWQRASAAGAGLALGFAMASKGTAYVMAPGLAAGLLLGAAPAVRRSWLLAAPVLLLAAFLVNAPHSYRNWRLNGHPLGMGTPDESVDGPSYANERFNAGALLSNVLRNAALEMTLRPAWSDGIHEAILAIHRAFNLDPNDPATTWQDTSYRPAYISNHEGVAANVRHTLLLGLAAAWLSWRRKLDRTAGLLLGVLFAFLLFCALLKWQPWHARMHLPLYVAACPVLAVWAEGALPRRLAALVLIWLFVNIRPAILHNALRPLGTGRSVFAAERYRQYFIDLPGLEVPYRLGAGLVARSGCRRVGMDLSVAPVEYPLMVRLRELSPETRFRHVGVRNSSARYEDHAPFAEPCAVVCFGCGHVAEKRQEYAGFGAPAMIGDLLIFLRR